MCKEPGSSPNHCYILFLPGLCMPVGTGQTCFKRKGRIMKPTWLYKHYKMITTKSVTYFDHKSEAASWAVSNIVNFVFAIPLRTLIVAQVHKESLNWPLDRKISKANLSNVFVSLQILRITLLCPMVDVVFLIKFMFPNIKHIYIYITMCTFFCFGRYFGLRTCWRSQSFGSNHWICCDIILRQENDGVWLPCSLWKWCRCRTSAIDRRFRVLF